MIKKAELVLSAEGHNGVVTTLPDLGNAIDITEFSGFITLADNLYRIIGVFGDNNHGIKDQQLVKVIKNTTYGKLAWNTTKSNDWASTSLNETLNSTFKTEKLSGFEDKIANVTWRTSGYSSSDITAKTAYTGEITNATKTHTAKIGLMYPSDYGYATIPDY